MFYKGNCKCQLPCALLSPRYLCVCFIVLFMSKLNGLNLPRILLMLELWRSGYALRIWRRSSRAHTMNAFIGLLIWLRVADVDPPPAVTAAVVDVVATNEEVEDDWPQTTSRLDLLPERTIRADSIFSARSSQNNCTHFKKAYMQNFST